MTFLPSKVQTGACSSSSTRSLKYVPFCLRSSSWLVRKDSGLVRVTVAAMNERLRLRLNILSRDAGVFIKGGELEPERVLDRWSPVPLVAVRLRAVSLRGRRSRP